MNEDQTPITKKDLREALDAARQDFREATKQDLREALDAARQDLREAAKQDLREALDAAVQSILTALHAEIAASEERSQEFARTIETNMLTSFHGYARGQTARLHTVEIGASDLAIRVAALEDRMLNLEARRPTQ
jgi:hypothetical protein